MDKCPFVLTIFQPLLTFSRFCPSILKATYVAAQEFAKRMLELKLPAKVINIGSVTSFRGMYNVSAYASSKGGVIQATKAFSNELTPHNIQVNCICPG